VVGAPIVVANLAQIVTSLIGGDNRFAPEAAIDL
jgi:hypothetical protein